LLRHATQQAWQNVKSGSFISLWFRLIGAHEFSQVVDEDQPTATDLPTPQDVLLNKNLDLARADSEHRAGVLHADCDPFHFPDPPPSKTRITKTMG